MNKTTLPSIFCNTILLSLFIVNISAAQTQLPMTPDKYPSLCQSDSNATPDWLKKLAETESKSITEYTTQEWYKEWEKTTLSRCTDLSTVSVDVDGHKSYYPVKIVYWRNDRSPLFRGGGGRSPSAIFKTGIYPWKYNGSINFPSGSKNIESSIVNTGYWPNYIFEMDYGILAGNNGYLIDAPGGISQTLTQIADNVYRQPNQIKKPLNTYADKNADKNVVVFPGGIRSEFIKGAFNLNTKSHHLQYYPNPNYAFSHPQADEFDLIVPNLSMVGHKSVITVTPQGKLIGGITHRFKKNTIIKVSIDNSYSDSCWRVNLDKRSKKNESLLTIYPENEPLSVEVVYRGTCGENLTEK